MPAHKLPPEAKKTESLQTRVDSGSYGAFLALSTALGYKRPADFLRNLVHEALAQSQQRVAAHQQKLQQDHEKRMAEINAYAAKAVVPISPRH